LSSPYDRLIDDDDLESMNSYAELLLRQPEAANPHLANLAKAVRALYRHIRAREEIAALSIPAGDLMETE
jgi:hypothetical protein